MKFLAVLTLAAVAVAAPAEQSPPPQECSPAQYACTKDNNGWLVCNVNGTWLVGDPATR